MQKLLETQKVTRNTKSCQKKIAEQLVESPILLKTVTKESKQTKIKAFVLVVDLNVLNGSTKSRFKIFSWNFLYEKELTVSFNKFLILLGCRSR